jgi:hypothetical protein
VLQAVERNSAHIDAVENNSPVREFHRLRTEAREYGLQLTIPGIPGRLSDSCSAKVGTAGVADRRRRARVRVTELKAEAAMGVAVGFGASLAPADGLNGGRLGQLSAVVQNYLTGDIDRRLSPGVDFG